MSTILGRFSEYLNMEGIGTGDLPELEEAIEIYLDQGGLIKLDDSSKDRPKLIYPDTKRLKKQLRRTKEKEKHLQGEVTNLRKRKEQKLKKYLDPVKKAFNPVYWEHKYKKRTNEEYKKAYEKIQPPVEKLNDPEWRDMVKMFVREPEYRERLLEAAKSEISKGKGTIREEMQKRQEFSDEVVDKRIDKLQSKLDKYREKKKALQRLLKLAKRQR